MNVYELIKSVLNFNKNNFEKGLATLASIQDKVAEKGNELLDNYSLFPEQGKEIVAQWATAMKNSRQLVLVASGKNYQEFENYLSLKK